MLELLRETFDCVELLRQFRQRAFFEHSIYEESKILTILVNLMEEQKRAILKLQDELGWYEDEKRTIQ